MKYFSFSKNAIAWFKLYLCEQKFKTINSSYSSPSGLSCDVPQGSILGPLLFLLCLNNPHPSCCQQLVYADHTYIIFQNKSITEIEKQLIRDFSSFYDWFVDDKLSIHFPGKGMWL